MEVKQELLEETTFHVAKVKFTFTGVDDLDSDEVHEAVDAGLQCFIEKGYGVTDEDQYFEAAGKEPWTGYRIFWLEREE